MCVRIACSSAWCKQPCAGKLLLLIITQAQILMYSTTAQQDSDLIWYDSHYQQMMGIAVRGMGDTLGRQFTSPNEVR